MSPFLRILASLVAVLLLRTPFALSFVCVSPTPTWTTSIATKSPIHAPRWGKTTALHASAHVLQSGKKQVRVTINGKPAPAAKTGQTVLAVAQKIGVRIPTYCKRGACGTCVCYMNYRKVHACKEKIPSHGQIEIQTID